MSEVTKLDPRTPVYQVGNQLLTKAQVQQRVASITTQLAQLTEKANADLTTWTDALNKINSIEAVN